MFRCFSQCFLLALTAGLGVVFTPKHVAIASHSNTFYMEITTKKQFAVQVWQGELPARVHVHAAQNKKTKKKQTTFIITCRT